MGFGGPHAAFMATHESFKRSLPGRIIGATKDANGDLAYRLALQTREQHIRREKATSNICTSQALLAVMAGFYALYHGPDGLRAIAEEIHKKTCFLYTCLKEHNQIKSDNFFDTLVITKTTTTAKELEQHKINVNWLDENSYSLSVDETTTDADIDELVKCLGSSNESYTASKIKKIKIPSSLQRQSSFMDQDRFHKYHSETEMMRYIKRLSDKDIALDRSMIPLGSCTMKLNSASEMAPVSWP